MPLRARLLALGLLAACGTPKQPSTPPSSTSAAPADAGSKAAATCSETSLPDTPLAQRATALFEALDSGDTKQLEALVTKQFAPQFQQIAPLSGHVDVLQGIHTETGGVTLCRVDFAADTEAVLLLGPERGDAFEVLTMAVEHEAPHRISSLAFEPVSRDALDDPPTPLDDAARHAMIESVAAALDGYIFANVAAEMQAHIRSERDAGRYATLTHRLGLARTLTRDLRRVSKDKHLSIYYSARPLPPDPPGEPPAPSPAELERMKAEAARNGFGIAKVEVLDGNIGYVDIRGFHPVDLVREGLAEAMTKIADTKALIVDLRHNGGGDPATVAFVTSYLFGKKKVHLNDLYYRRNDETTEYWTDPEVSGKHFGGKKPIYVLTSNQTFSGGEEFAYNLRNLERATLIGETTGGGAHPVDGVRIDEHVLVFVPVGRAINPITKTNWEGKGVEPHVAVPADEALDEAKALIAGKK